MLHSAAGVRASGSARSVSRQQHRGAAVPQARRAVAFAPSRRAAAAVCRAGKLISKTEVPAFIQRDDMMDQIVRWAMIEVAESGHRNFGLPMNVERLMKDEVLNGVQISIMKEGTKLTDIVIEFDNENTLKYDWIGINQEDMSIVPEGDAKDVMGKHIEIK